MHHIAVCEKSKLKNWYAFHFIKDVWRRFEVCVLKVACSLIPLHAHWLRWEQCWISQRSVLFRFFPRYQLSRFFWVFKFSNDFAWNKVISFVIWEQFLHIKIGRIFIKRATAYVESFCQRYARKQVIKNACSSFLYRHPLENFHVQHSNAFHISDDSALCPLQYWFTISKTVPTTVENNNWGQSLMLYSSQCSGWTAICILKQ